MRREPLQFRFPLLRLRPRFAHPSSFLLLLILRQSGPARTEVFGGVLLQRDIGKSRPAFKRAPSLRQGGVFRGREGFKTSVFIVGTRGLGEFVDPADDPE